MIKPFFSLSFYPFKKDIDKIFVTDSFKYLKTRFEHFVETQGIALLTGEIGSGKTTFMRHFISNLDDRTYRSFYLSGTIQRPRGFFRLLAQELGLPAGYFVEDLTAQVKAEFSSLFQKYHLRPILVIDEAQNLSDSVLEEIRLLTNFRMDSKNYLSLILMGHPVLKARLKLSPYAALRQRLSFVYHLTGLSQDELHPYMNHRITLADGPESLFSEDSERAIFNYSKGLPRLINGLAHEALYQAAEKKQKRVEEDLVESIIQEWETL